MDKTHPGTAHAHVPLDPDSREVCSCGHQRLVRVAFPSNKAALNMQDGQPEYLLFLQLHMTSYCMHSSSEHLTIDIGWKLGH